MNEENIKRFWEKVVKGSTCWIWQGGKNTNGYGFFSPFKKSAHVAAYELLVGPVPLGRVLHHKCETPACVNPDHLEPLTPREHLAKHGLIHLTECARGHKKTEDNTYVTTRGGRECRICRRERKRIGYNPS